MTHGYTTPELNYYICSKTVTNLPKNMFLQFYYNTPWFIFVRVNSIFRGIYVHILGIILHLHCNNPFLPGRLLRNGQFTPKKDRSLGDNELD